MEYTKLFSTFGARLTTSDKHNKKSELIISNKKQKEVERLKQQEQEDIFNSSPTPLKEKTMKNLVLKFRNHVNNDISKKKPKFQSVLFASERSFAIKNNHAIDYKKSLPKSKARIPPIKTHSTFYIDNTFKIEHNTFLNMTKMQPRKSKWLKTTQYSFSFNNIDEGLEGNNHRYNTISGGRDPDKTSSMSFREQRPSHLKEFPRQICHSPNIAAILPKTKGTVDLSASEKKTKSKIAYGSLRYYLLDKKENPEYNNYSTIGIEKNKASFDFKNGSKVRDNNNSNLPLFMCKIHSGNGNYVITDKSLQLNNYAMGPLRGSYNYDLNNNKKKILPLAYNKGRNDKEQDNNDNEGKMGENYFKNIKAKKYKCFMKHMKRQINYYKLKL